jgi:hypothetical protein
MEKSAWDSVWTEETGRKAYFSDRTEVRQKTLVFLIFLIATAYLSPKRATYPQNQAVYPQKTTHRTSTK